MVASFDDCVARGGARRAGARPRTGRHLLGVLSVSLAPGMQQGPRSVGGIGIIAHVDPGYAGRTVVGGRNGDAMRCDAKELLTQEFKEPVK